MQRKIIGRSQAKRDFRRGARVHGRNFAMAKRGGYRI